MKIIAITLSLILLIACSEQVDVDDNPKEDAVREDTIAQVVDSSKRVSIDEMYFGNGDYMISEPTDDGVIYKTYFKDGQLQSVAEQGDFAGCGMQVGIELMYDEWGNLLQEKTFENFLPEDAIGCHETRTVISTTMYYESGSIKAKFQYETCYECDQCPCGEWIDYNEAGEITETEYHEDCYDFRLNCYEF